MRKDRPKRKLKIGNLTKIYNGKQDESMCALNNVNMEIYDKEFVSIIGPSGCGKTTLLEIVAGFQLPTSGRIEIDPKSMNRHEGTPGIVFQEYALFPWQTIRSNIEFGPRARGIPKKERTRLSGQLLELMGLAGFENHYPHELSGGMKQRAAIARTLANDPDILLMDEPFTALDALMRETLQQELLNVWEQQRKTILFVTHNIAEALFLSDRIIIMSSRPGSVAHIVDVDLPRPRGKETRISPSFHENEDLIRELVWQEAEKANSVTY